MTRGYHSKITKEGQQLEKLWKWKRQGIWSLFYDILRTAYERSERPRLSLTRVLHTLEISTSGYYSQLSLGKIMDSGLNPYTINYKGERFMMDYRLSSRDELPCSCVGDNQRGFRLSVSQFSLQVHQEARAGHWLTEDILDSVKDAEIAFA
jgi:hypothetical protein